jgi:hypothetical protein
VTENSGERGRNRTYNLLIKSQLLYQLSYAPTKGAFSLALHPPSDGQARRVLRFS